MSASPVVGIVGSAGAYGHWLGRFLRERMDLKVIGYDPADPASLSPAQLLRCADVLVFSVPIRKTAALIGEYVAMADGTDAGQLWIDVTSIKQAPVEAMLASASGGSWLASYDCTTQGTHAKGPCVGGLRGAATSLAPVVDAVV